jgi:hypothetical protein
MSTLAPTLQAFFTDRLARQRQASSHTIAAYVQCPLCRDRGVHGGLR